jgi:hypothetical protein
VIARTLPRLAGAVAAVGLSFVLVGTTPATAEAAVGITIPPVVAEAGEILAGGAEAEEAAAAGATCAATVGVGCVVEAGVVIGIGLYATHDIWLPTVKGWLNHLRGNQDAQDPAAAWILQGNVAVDPNHANQVTFDGTMNVPTSNSAHSKQWAIYLHVAANSQCVHADGSRTYVSSNGAGIATNFATGYLTADGGSGFGPLAVAVCPVGTWIASGTIMASEGRWGSQTKDSAPFTITSPVQPPELVKYVSTSHCVDPADNSVHDVQTSITGYPDQLPIPSCQAHGWIPTGVTIINPDTGQQVDNWTLDNPASQFGNCFTGGTLTCTTKVYVNGVPCTSSTAPTHCVDWHSWVQTHPNADIECHFGPYVVALKTCDPLIQAYPSPGTTVDTSPSTDGHWYPDPDHQGDPQPQPDPDPDPSDNPTPTTPPTTDPVPQEGTNPDPGDGSGSCLGGVWSLNPVNWVYTPVKCAMLWAFDPQVSLETRAQTMQAAFTGRAPFGWFGSLFALPGNLPSESCPDWRVKIPTPGWGGAGNDFDQNVVCDSPYIDSLRAARPVLAAGMIALAFTPLLRGLAYASIPLLKPTPTDGK